MGYTIGFVSSINCAMAMLSEKANNTAERGIRPAVQWRIHCFGNQSEAGERFTERILTVTRTCQLRGKNPFYFLAELMEAAFKGLPRPALLN